MSQRVGDIGSELMSCGNPSEIKKYGSEQACMDAKLIPNKKKSQKINKQYLMYGLIAVVGYFAYKNFK